MGKRRRRFQSMNGLNGVDRFYYPYRFMPPEIGGSRYMDMTTDLEMRDLLLPNVEPRTSYADERKDDHEHANSVEDL